MAFLDNSGDIILDAVLTDEGRRRLAEGKGGFSITKFALGDDEIDYGLYNKDHANGSAYFDLEILQTPIFEAFTNNASSMKSKIITINNPNLLYLPVIKLNDKSARGPVEEKFGVNTFLIPVDKTTNEQFSGANIGILRSPAHDKLSSTGNRFIRLDQGLDADSISPGAPLSADLREDAFIIEMDDRLGGLVSGLGTQEFTEKAPSNVDDDDIATYIISATTDNSFVRQNKNSENDGGQVIAGPRGNIMQFRVRPKVDLADSDNYFNSFGSTATTTGANAIVGASTITSVKYIDSFVTIYGASTGYTVQVPIRYIKDNS